MALFSPAPLLPTSRSASGTARTNAFPSSVTLHGSSDASKSPLPALHAWKQNAVESPWLLDTNGFTQLVTIEQDEAVAAPEGLGIREFLKNARLLVTGATGFIGKVLIEKILRAQPDVDKIYLLVNADSDEKAQRRLRNDILESRVFCRLREKYGSLYSEFMLGKLVAVPGSVTTKDLGLDQLTKARLWEVLDVIVNAAATTNFSERYDVALNVNTRGPLNALEFAKICKRLQLFLHVSTAFVSGTTQGTILEEPFTIGERHREDFAASLDVWKEIESVEKMSGSTQGLRELGMRRAGLHGWQDTYVFTKAMGEMLVSEARAHVPVVILRPSVVESTLAQPFGGWIQGTRMLDPILLACGLGYLKGFYADPNNVLDVIPADMVVNSLLAAMSLHAGQPGLHIYHVGSSTVNPLTLNKIAASTVKHFQSFPVFDTRANRAIDPKLTLYENKLAFSVHKFLNYRLPVQIARLSKSHSLRSRAKMTSILAARLDQLVETYSPYSFYKGRFDISNTRRLYELMSPEEKVEFDFHIKSIKWEEYITNVHIPGLRNYSNGAASSKFQLITIKESVQGLLAV